MNRRNYEITGIDKERRAIHVGPSRDLAGTGVWAFNNPWRPANVADYGKPFPGRTALHFGTLDFTVERVRRDYVVRKFWADKEVA